MPLPTPVYGRTAPPTPRQPLSVSIYRSSFFAIHYYNISEYACKSTIIISEKGKMFLKSLQKKQMMIDDNGLRNTRTKRIYEKV